MTFACLVEGTSAPPTSTRAKEPWAFKPIIKPIVPNLPHQAWTQNPIDHFILKKLNEVGLKPSPSATATTLLRRLALDLNGTIPSVDQLDQFVREIRNGQSDSAYRRWVERLLSSERYGERMAWEWLEAARYADSNGYQGDSERTMWPWRDWVVSAFNRNLPFDVFSTYQIAGDLAPSPSQEQILATGFLRNHMINGEGGRIPEENRIDYVMDMTETVGTVWLGLTLNCARCHDHKYDPITHQEYYSLFALFNQTPVTGGGGDPQTKPVIEVASFEQSQRKLQLQSLLTELIKQVETEESKLFGTTNRIEFKNLPDFSTYPKEAQDALLLPPAQRDASKASKISEALRGKSDNASDASKRHATVLSDRAKLESSIPKVMVMQDQPVVRETFLLNKGLYDKPREKVLPGIPSSLMRLGSTEITNRLQLSQWLFSGKNPLVARVIVNRLWQQFFGLGLVKTVEDFGVQSELPSHPELLDWLASEFMESHWDLKHLCRLVVTSATYRQLSSQSPEVQEKDPENRYLSHGPRYRMPSWMIRDRALLASGLLLDQSGGAPVRPYQPSGVWEEATFGNKRYQQDQGAALYRRSLYVFWRRIVAPTLFFDTASRQVCTVKQPRTNTPLQALATLNDDTYMEASKHLALTVARSQPLSQKSRIRELFRRVLNREPNDKELSRFDAASKAHELEFRMNLEAAHAVLSVGDSKLPSLSPLPLTAPELAALTVVSATILNLDEALSKQ